MPEPLVVPTKAHWEQAMVEIDRELLDAYPQPSDTERKALVEERAHQLAASMPRPPAAGETANDLVSLGEALVKSLTYVLMMVENGYEVPSEQMVKARMRVRAWDAEIKARQERVKA